MTDPGAPATLTEAVARGRKAIKVFSVAAVIAALLGLVVTQRTFASLEDGLAVADAAAVAAAAAVDPASQLADDLAALADSLAEGTDAAAALADRASTSSADLGAAAQDNLATTLDGLASTADRLASATERIERFIPGDASPSAADELRDVADGLEPTADQVRSLGVQLDDAADDLARIADQLEASAAQVATIGADIGEAKATIDTLPGLVEEVDQAIGQTRDRLALDAWLVALLILALTFAVLAAAFTADRILVALGASTPASPDRAADAGLAGG